MDSRPSQSSARALAATHDEFAGLLRATETARDRRMVAITACCALRVGQLVSLMREDMHFVPASRTAPGCSYVLGPHIHLRKRGGHPKGAANKNRGVVIGPVPGAVEMLYADWMREGARGEQSATPDDNPEVEELSRERDQALATVRRKEADPLSLRNVVQRLMVENTRLLGGDAAAPQDL
ncbi:hypothetical protein ABZ682_41095 [Streptomyces griseoviridis]|uniref:hypothetical protein n=1 Tax=Streptomyces TaxID=1883 RepID=UPI002475EC38|nr:hypothetical protein [Streptomyces sp. MAA16]